MKFLLIGDVVGKSGEDTLNKFLSKRGKDYDVIIVNGENIDKGFGIVPNIAKNIIYNGVDVITLGNHTFDKKEIYDYLEKEPKIIRPYNFSKESPGRGYTIFEKKGKKLLVINLQGKVFMNNTIYCPFLSIDKLIKKIEDSVDIIVVDFHAEATSEKLAMGWNLASKVSIVYGTHTHIQTADERILNNHTAYITDIGMTGGHDGILGMNKKEVISKFKNGLPVKFSICEQGKRINALEVLIDSNNKAKNIKRINMAYEEI